MKRTLALTFTLVFLVLTLDAQTVMTGNHRKVFASSGSLSQKGTPVCGSGASSTSESISYTAAQTGDELFLTMYNGGANYTVSAVAYNGSSASTIVAQASGNGYSGIWEVTLISSGAHNVTWTNSTGFGTSYCFIEFSGVNSVGNKTTTSSSVSPYSVSLSITENNGYVLGNAVNAGSAAVTPTATGGTIPAYRAYGYNNLFMQINTAGSPGSVALAGTLSTSASLKWNLIELKY